MYIFLLIYIHIYIDYKLDTQLRTKSFCDFLKPVGNPKSAIMHGWVDKCWILSKNTGLYPENGLDEMI